jgi:hypothetical protein
MALRKALSFAAAAVLFLVPTAGAHDGDPPQLNRVLGDKLSIRVLGGLVDLNTDVAAGSSLGALIDLEDILGFDEQISTFGFEGLWRFTKNQRHALHLTYGNFDRSAYKAVEGTVPIFDVEFFGEIDSSFVNQVFVLEYQYTLVNHHNTEAGFSVGLGTYKYELILEGQVKIGGEPGLGQFRREDVGVIAPVPAVGFYINQALRPDLIVELRTSFIDLEIGEHNGRIFRSWGTLTWFFARHWGVGLGLAGSDVVYDQKTSDRRIKVDLRQSSMTINVTAVF